MIWPRLLIIVGIIFVGTSCSKDKISAEKSDHEILSLILRDFNPGYREIDSEGGGYWIVDPEAGFINMDVDTSEKVEGIKKWLKEELKGKGRRMNELIDLLFEKNLKPTPLSLESSPELGYIIDYERSPEKYFGKNGGGYAEFYRDNPLARGILRTSIPVWDKKSGIIILFLGEFYGELSAEGNIRVYQYEKNELRQIAKILVWIS